MEVEPNFDLLAKFRRVEANLGCPSYLTQSPEHIWFGAKISLLSPYVVDPSTRGVMVQAYISEFDIDYHQNFFDGIGLGATNDEPLAANTFVIVPADIFSGEGDLLRFDQDFYLALASSVEQGQPLFMRYDPEPLPGYNSESPLYLSKNPVSNTRWKLLPTRDPGNTRFEQEGIPVKVNSDLILCHTKSNQNLCVGDEWKIGLSKHVRIFNKIPSYLRRTLLVKTKLDKHRVETAENIWRIYSAIPDKPSN